MRRSFLSVSVVLFVALAAYGLAGTRIAAQEATPAAGPNLIVGELAPLGEPFEAVPGVDLVFLNEGQPAGAPGQSLVLYRVTLRGGEVPSHIHPGATLLTVESGMLSWTLQAGTVTVTRPGTAAEDVTEPGTEIVLNPGEGLSYDADVVHTARAAGDEPAVLLVASLFAVGQPFITPSDEKGTPLAMGTPAA